MTGVLISPVIGIDAPGTYHLIAQAFVDGQAVQVRLLVNGERLVCSAIFFDRDWVRYEWSAYLLAGDNVRAVVRSASGAVFPYDLEAIRLD
jgi:hypothetical protein